MNDAYICWILQTTLRRLQTSGELFPFPYSIPIFTARLAPHILKPVSPCLLSQALHDLITRSTYSAHTFSYTPNHRTSHTSESLHTHIRTHKHTHRWGKLPEMKVWRIHCGNKHDKDSLHIPHGKCKYFIQAESWTTHIHTGLAPTFPNPFTHWLL